MAGTGSGGGRWWVGGMPKKLCSREGADGAIEVAAALVDRVPLPPQAILAFFPDLAVKADDANFLKVHGRHTILEVSCPEISQNTPRLALYS